MRRPLAKLLREISGIWKTMDKGTFLLYLAKMLWHWREIWKSKKLRVVDQSMRRRLCRIKLSCGQRMVIKGSDFGLAREILCRRVYSRVPGFEIMPDDYVVDLGANTGIFTTYAALCGRRVLAVEAQSGFIPILKSNLHLNHCEEKVDVQFGLVGSTKGIFSTESGRKSASHWGDAPPIFSLNDLVEMYKISQIDFMKVDIEGSEFGLFEDDLQSLRKVRRLAMEVHFDFGSEQFLKDLLQHYGFRVWLLDYDLDMLFHSRVKNQKGCYLFAAANNSQAS